MPTLIRGVSEILAERQADTLFVQFKVVKGRRLRSSSDNADASAIFNWLEAHDIKYELACPDGHLEGYSGLHAIYFPRLTTLSIWNSLTSSRPRTARAKSRTPMCCLSPSTTRGAPQCQSPNATEGRVSIYAQQEARS